MCERVKGWELSVLYVFTYFLLSLYLYMLLVVRNNREASKQSGRALHTALHYTEPVTTVFCLMIGGNTEAGGELSTALPLLYASV